MSDDPKPIDVRALRLQSTGLETRVAVPADPPELSLIPSDVMLAFELETAALESTPLPNRTPPSVPEVPLLVRGAADPEVAIFALSRVDLFREVSAASLEGLAGAAAQIEIAGGENLFIEGEEAKSFFVVVDGTLELLRRQGERAVALRHVSAGDALGLFGLFSAQLRAASSRAIGDCVALEIPADSLRAVVDRDDLLHGRLLRYFRERLLESFLSTPLFTDLDPIAKARLLGRFRHIDVERGHVFLQPGEVSNLIAVVTHGSLLVEERVPLGGPRHREVGTGHFAAVIAALAGRPAKARISASDACALSMVSHKDFHELLADCPALRGLPTRLVEHAQRIDAEVFCGSAGVPGL